MSLAPRADLTPGAPESAMRIPGAVAAVFGDLGNGTVLGSTTHPTLTDGFPAACGKAVIALSAGAGTEFTESSQSQSIEGVIVTGRRYFCMLRAGHGPGVVAV
jgi:hypothetical protein